MRELRGRRYWLVGASEGLGRAVAERLSAEGAELVLSARSAERLAELAASLPAKADTVPVDIADESSVAEAAKAAAAAGALDGVVLLAGVYWPMKATEWQAAEGVAMADVNFTGTMRVLGAVMPDFLRRDAGHIVITGSLSGFRGLPGAIGYGASKAAVMSLAESMHADLRRTGIDVQLVNPGFVRTRLTEKNDFAMPFIMSPEDAAAEVVAHMRGRRFSRSFPFLFSLVFRLGRFLPDWLYFRIFS